MQSEDLVVRYRYRLSSACLAAGLAVIAVIASAGTRDVVADKVQIVRLEQRWLNLATSDDRHALASIFADDFIDVSVKGEIRDKADVIAHSATPAHVTQSIKDLTVRVWGDTAVATGIDQIHSNDKGWTVEVPFTDTFARIEERWRAVSSQETLRKSDSEH
jgi:ketosteroid isomerase-like protein